MGLLFFSIATSFLYSSSLKGYTIEYYPSVAGGSRGRFGLDGMVPLPLTRSWCTNWFALTRHGGLDVVGSLDSFRLPRFTTVMSHIGGRDDFLPSLPFPPSFCLSVYFQVLWYHRQRGCLNTCTCMLHIDSLIRQ